MPRFFLEELDESDVCITGPDARHIGLALRMRVGEMLTVCAYGRDYQCRIRSITPEEVHLDFYLVLLRGIFILPYAKKSLALPHEAVVSQHLPVFIGGIHIKEEQAARLHKEL